MDKNINNDHRRIGFHPQIMSHQKELNKTLKQNIQLLAELFSHQLTYEKYAIHLNSTLNNITIWAEDKYALLVCFNLENKSQQIKIEHYAIYHVLLELMQRRTDTQNVSLPHHELLSLDKVWSEERYSVQEELKKQRITTGQENMVYHDFSGNRYLVRYFKGILILKDDLCYAMSNVVKLD